MQIVSTCHFREMLKSENRIVALCGAGTSIPAPTNLPSGNELRDLCVEGLLRDEKNSDLVGKLLASPGYRAMLPESVLQEIGYFSQSNIDDLLAETLHTSTPNASHRAIAERFPEIFTTNFDTCFEQAGAQQVHHLHGSIDHPSSLQNALWRLGRTAPEALALFRERVRTHPVSVTGYSLRDADIYNALTANDSLDLLFLSHTADVPRLLGTLSGRVTCAIGTLEQILEFCPSSEVPSNRKPVAVRKPAQGLRALALMYLYGTMGEVASVKDLMFRYRRRLAGRDLLRAKGVLADTMRGAQAFAESYAVCESAIRLPSYARDENLDLQSYILNLMALCEHEGFGRPDRARALVLEALRAMNSFGRKNLAENTPARVAVWRAKLANNLGNIQRDMGQSLRAEKLYKFSVQKKLSYGEEGSAAQTYSNLSVLKINEGNLDEAEQYLSAVVEAMHKSPEAYICRSAIYDSSIALYQRFNGDVDSITFGEVDIDALQEFIHARMPDETCAQKIIEKLKEIEAILTIAYQ